MTNTSYFADIDNFMHVLAASRNCTHKTGVRRLSIRIGVRGRGRGECQIWDGLPRAQLNATVGWMGRGKGEEWWVVGRGLRLLRKNRVNNYLMIPK